MVAYVPKHTMKSVTADELHLLDDTCVGDDYNETFFRVSSAFDQCDTLAEVRQIL